MNRNITKIGVATATLLTSTLALSAGDTWALTTQHVVRAKPVATATVRLSSELDQPISREEIIERGNYWTSRRLPYSQAIKDAQPGPNGGPKYRLDCSGFISMAWKTDPGTYGGRNTDTLRDIATQITWDELAAGDMIDLATGPWADQHVVMFEAWADSGRTKMIVQEENGAYGAIRRTVPRSNYGSYVPYRYNNIMGDDLLTPEYAERGSGDFNGDGKTDVFSRGKYNGKWYWQYSSGGATSWIRLAQSGEGMSNMRFGDFNGDGKTDVFSRGKYNGKWYWQYSSGGTSGWIRLAQNGDPLSSLRFGDFNGDGKTDVFSRGLYNGKWYWRYSSGGASGWIKLAQSGEGMSNMRFGDFNGDGKTDVFSRGKYNGKWYWQYSSGGTSGWIRLAQSGEGLPYLRFGDFNGDGKTDVFSRGKYGGKWYWRYSSGGTSGWIRLAQSGEGMSNMRFGDFNGDGKTDVFSRGKYSGKWYWQYSSRGVSGWSRLAQADDPLTNLRFG